jgi:hypothetical protein
MYEAGQSEPLPELRDALRRLEACLARHEHDLHEAHLLHDAAAVELLRGGARLLAEEIERVRDQLVAEALGGWRAPAG